jgi:ribonuclease P protein component
MRAARVAGNRSAPEQDFGDPLIGSQEMTPDQTTANGSVGGGPVMSAPQRPPIEVMAKRADFLAAARGPRQAMPGFVLQAHPRPDPSGDTIRIGFTCTKKVGNAVARNRAKRRLRALARDVLPAVGVPGWDYVLIGRAGETATRDFARMRGDLDTALARLHAKAGK